MYQTLHTKVPIGFGFLAMFVVNVILCIFYVSSYLIQFIHSFPKIKRKCFPTVLDGLGKHFLLIFGKFSTALGNRLINDMVETGSLVV